MDVILPYFGVTEKNRKFTFGVLVVSIPICIGLSIATKRVFMKVNCFEKMVIVIVIANY